MLPHFVVNYLPDFQFYELYLLSYQEIVSDISGVRKYKCPSFNRKDNTVGTSITSNMPNRFQTVEKI